MDIKEKMQKFNQRWNISLYRKNHNQEIENFKTRIKNIFSDHFDKVITIEGKRIFCQYLGISNNSSYDLTWYFRDIKDEIEVYRFLEILFSIDFIVGGWKRGGKIMNSNEIKQIYFERLIEAMNFSNLNVSAISSKDEIHFYPKGEEFLDNEIVNNVLSFLSGASNEHFQGALNFYLNKEWIKVGESIRRTLEEYLRIKFENSKDLKANIVELGKLLKSAESPSQNRNIIIQTFNYLDDYFNDHTKHHDGDLDEFDAEFLIYQAGLLMRYISKVIK